jgi:hypothetical protein
VTPNQISMLAMLAGILSGICCALGTPSGFLLGALLYGLCNVFDCADGMVARLKGNGTRIGRIVDMSIDIVANLAVYLGLGIGLTRSGIDLGYNAWMLVVIAGISYAFHSAILDYYRNEYLARGLGRIVSLETEITEMREELRRYEAVPGAFVQRLVIRGYILLCRLQLRGSSPSLHVEASREYAERNRLAIRLWTVIGSASHIAALMIALLFDAPMLFFWFTIVVANIWALAVWLYQQTVDASVAAVEADLLHTHENLHN